jgi:glutathione synthase/RimK-type ligase-like ATP-grasp enzyme
VIKPSVSAAGWETHRLQKKNFSGFEEKFQTLLKKQNMLIQSYQKKITSFGEISLMMINGEYSHAVIKKAKGDEFRVQDDYGGTVETYMASITEINFAKTVMKKLNFCPLYARVDVILDNKNTLALSELELIEPEMWFRKNPNSVEKLAVEIKKRYF